LRTKDKLLDLQENHNQVHLKELSRNMTNNATLLLYDINNASIKTIADTNPHGQQKA
jgi:hypothetical protein